MMFSIRFFKTKYAGLIGMFFSLVMFMTGCQRKDEAIVLIPSGEDVAEFPSLEAVEQAAEPAGSSVTVQEPAKASAAQCGIPESWKCRRAAERRKPCDWSEV